MSWDYFFFLFFRFYFCLIKVSCVIVCCINNGHRLLAIYMRQVGVLRVLGWDIGTAAGWLGLAGIGDGGMGVWDICLDTIPQADSWSSLVLLHEFTCRL